MDKALIGFLVIFMILHLLLVVVPITTTLRANISGKSKILWCAFLALLPFIGVALFHFRFRSSLFLGKTWEPSPHDLGVRNPHDSTNDRD
jgi:glucan phosphoethanolaminetransferase (alkaline phosphatase superfamily)